MQCKKKKGYSTISNDTKTLLIGVFYDHPHVIVSPATKDTVHVKNADGVRVPVQKVMSMVGLGTIFSDIVQENPTIKNKVSEPAFRYIIMALGCVRRFTNSHKTMCGCTQCVGLQMMHRSLQAKCGGIQRQIAIDLQIRTRKVRADEMSRGWGDPGLHTTHLDAIRAGTCARWTAHAVPHWKCQTLQCSECMDYPVPVEEAHEDADAEHISFHIYERKKSEQKDGTEQTQLELVHMTTKIGEFHHLYYGPALKKGRYHMTSYKIAACCRRERREIEEGCVSSHRDYGDRMGLSFNEEIQSQYYQNTSVSVDN